MGKGLYARLATDNIKRNSQTYIPYIITCVITTAMAYIIRSLSLNNGLDKMNGGYALKDILAFGSHVTRVFAFIFLFYTNSFLMKRRKKEFGLFNILGMEKRHIARVLFLETLYTAFISLVAGFGVGILLDKLLFLAITKMLRGNVQLGFRVSWESIVMVSVFMLFTFLMIHLNALRQIHLAKPVELLQGSNMGEREPKAKWLMAVLGVGLIGAGYYISIVTKNPLQALTMFFVAVLCVIIGTYFLFAAGSIALLKLLKKNKKYYYKINHFTSVSGMMYRMKQNAVGLANICILSTMVLVMISTTSCFMAGLNGIINARYPYEFSVRAFDDDMPKKLERFFEENDTDVTETKTYTSLVFETIRDGNSFIIPEEYTMDMEYLTELGVIDLADYNQLTGKNVELSDDSVLLWTDDKDISFDEFTVINKTYSVAQQLEEYPINTTGVVKSVCLVVKDRAAVEELYNIQKEVYGDMASDIWKYYHFNVGNKVDQEKLANELHSYMTGNDVHGYSIDTKYGAFEDAIGLYGGLFFLGIFLGTLFMMETILIIYYKQISEGFDDQKRFKIMQNVGMSKAEVKKSIHSQIITVFFLPLITAGVHTGFSFPLIKRMLLMFHMKDTVLFALCLLICFGAFALIYALIYGITARTYYRIVSK